MFRILKKDLEELSLIDGFILLLISVIGFVIFIKSSSIPIQLAGIFVYLGFGGVSTLSIISNLLRSTKKMKQLEERKEKPELGQILRPYIWFAFLVGVVAILFLWALSVGQFLSNILGVVEGFILCLACHYLWLARMNRPKERVRCPKCKNENINWFTFITNKEEILPEDTIITTSDKKEYACDRCRTRNSSF